MFAVSLLHDVAFDAFFGRPPVSNMEPLLDALFAEGPRIPAAIGLAFVVVGIAPLIEELVYRGVLYRAFRDRGGVALGIAGSSRGVAPREVGRIAAFRAAPDDPTATGEHGRETERDDETRKDGRPRARGTILRLHRRHPSSSIIAAVFSYASATHSTIRSGSGAYSSSIDTVRS